MEENKEKNTANKTVIVTGGSRGIGAEIVKILTRENYQVALNYNKSEEQEKNTMRKFIYSYFSFLRSLLIV